MKNNLQSMIQLSLKAFVACVAAGYVGLYVFVACQRAPYPFCLEWLEYAMVDHVARVLEGKPLYVAPSLDFIPFIYNPIYYYASAALARFMGLGLTPLRMVSIAASLGCFAVIALFVRRETRSGWAALVAAGLFAATYNAGGAWLDIARVDSLFLLWTLLGVYTLRWARNAAQLVLAGILFALAFFTKQSGMLLAIPFLAWSVVCQTGVRRLTLPLAFTAAVGIPVLLMDRVSGGWYSFYAFKMSCGQPLITGWLHYFWVNDIASKVGIAFGLAVVSVVLGGKAQTWRLSLFYLVLLAAGLGTSLAGRLHTGGYDNAALPCYAAIALVFGSFLPSWLSSAKSKDGAPPAVDSTTSWPPPLGAAAPGILVLSLCLVQFASMFYNPSVRIPSKGDRRAGEALVRHLQSLEGEILAPRMNYFLTLAGKKTCANTAAWDDILRSTARDVRNALGDEVGAALASGRYAYVLDDPQGFLVALLGPDYVDAGPVVDNLKVFKPRTGAWLQHDHLYMRRPAAATPPR